MSGEGAACRWKGRGGVSRGRGGSPRVAAVPVRAGPGQGREGSGAAAGRPRRSSPAAFFPSFFFSWALLSPSRFCLS